LLQISRNWFVGESQQGNAEQGQNIAKIILELQKANKTKERVKSFGLNLHKNHKLKQTQRSFDCL
jgi:hypothetical protein